MSIAPRLKGSSEAIGACWRPCPQKQETALDDSRPGKAFMQLMSRTLPRITPGKSPGVRFSKSKLLKRSRYTMRHLSTNHRSTSASRSCVNRILFAATSILVTSAPNSLIEIRSPLTRRACLFYSWLWEYACARIPTTVSKALSTCWC